MWQSECKRKGGLENSDLGIQRGPVLFNHSRNNKRRKKPILATLLGKESNIFREINDSVFNNKTLRNCINKAQELSDKDSKVRGRLPGHMTSKGDRLVDPQTLEENHLDYPSLTSSSVFITSSTEKN